MENECRYLSLPEYTELSLPSVAHCRLLDKALMVIGDEPVTAVNCPFWEYRVVNNNCTFKSPLPDSVFALLDQALDSQTK